MKLSTLAADVTKPSKAEARGLLEVLHQELPHRSEELARLYARLHPPQGGAKKKATDPATDALQWVARAAGKPEPPYTYRGYILVQQGQILATDGLRLHVAANPGVADGLYDPKSLARIPNPPVSWPRWRAAVTSQDWRGPEPVSWDRLEVKTGPRSGTKLYWVPTVLGAQPVRKRDLDAALVRTTDPIKAYVDHHRTQLRLKQLGPEQGDQAIIGTSRRP